MHVDVIQSVWQCNGITTIMVQFFGDQILQNGFAAPMIFTNDCQNSW